MKIVIIGAMEKQIPLMGDFPYLDIRCANKEAHNGTGENQLYKHADRLLVMTKFISHGLFDKLDRAKVIFVNGGITRARDILTTLNAVARIATQPVTTAQEDEEDMRIFDFKPLRHARTGEQLVFNKPNEQSVEPFKLAMEQGRSYYKRMYGVLSTQDVTGGGNKATITITRSAAEYEAHETMLKEATARVTTPAVEAEVPDVVIGSAELATEAPPATLPAPPKLSVEQRWWEVFMTSLSLRPSASESIHVATANAACDAYIARFRA